MENVEQVSAEPKPANFEQNILLTAKGGSFLFVGKVFTFGSRFVVTFLLTRLLGAEAYGLYNIGLSAATIAYGLALLGMDTALVRYVALYASRRDERGLWGSLQIAVVISMGLSALMSATLFGLAHVIAVNIFHDDALAPVLQLSAFLVPFLGLSDVLAGATRGFKHMEHMVIAQNFAQPLVRVVLLIVFSLIGLNIAAAIVIYGVADFTASLILLYFLNTLFSLRRPLGLARHETGQMLSYSVPMWISDMIGTFRGNIQTVLLGSLKSVFTVGVFSVANQLNLVGDLVQTSVTTAVRPIIVEVHEHGNREQLGRLYQAVSKWIFAFNFPIFLIIVLFPDQVLSIFGKSFEQGATALVLLSWAGLVDAITGMCGAIIDMTGYTRLKMLNAVTRLGSEIILSLLLIPGYGMVGAAIAALVGECLVNAMRVAEVYFIFRLLPYNLSSIKPILAGTTSGMLVFLIGLLLPNSPGPADVLLRMALLVTMYVGLIIAEGLDPEDQAILSRIKRRATRKMTQARA